MGRSDNPSLRKVQGRESLLKRPLRTSKAAYLCGLVGILLAQGAMAGTLEAINHTHWAINRFSVEGRSGLDIIGPYQGGGGGCCYVAPAQWKQGLTVRVEWETGAGSSEGFPGFADEEKYLAWRNNIRAQKRQHTGLSVFLCAGR
ncbi:hypothetical protein CQZ98_28770 [Pseudomonas sp. MYb115]|nr:hypothetical protein CQZ98_28770 [Pseudomonas sp. MYb115]QXN48203.1 DUF3304 domain-containing protein [Pseudomonas fluorescens]